MKDKKKTEQKSEMKIKKENQDFRNIPENLSSKNPPEISKKDVLKASELSKDGKTDNTEKN
ncbi:hypothetical protein [Halpernia sp.]|uniref:hypothetical protein n=1 Tax=Halpernia sp. TaxID=2782209 RepID=UPI003A8E54EA